MGGRHSYPRTRKVARPLLGALVVGVLFVTLLPTVSNANPVAGAAFTSFVDADTCLGGSPNGVNCNLYEEKEDVWINGGPAGGPAALSDGTYFFTVLEPGGQSDPNDGGAHVLSDTNTAGGDGGGLGDAYTNRIIDVDSTLLGGDITSYAGTHDSCNSNGAEGASVCDGIDTSAPNNRGLMVQLIPFDRTSNPGGVYILAMCRIDNLGGAYDPITNPVGPNDCKYDAFKVAGGEDEPVEVNAVLSGAKYRDDNRDGDWDDATEPGLQGWTINLDCDNNTFDTTTTTDVNGLWSITTPSSASTPGTVTCTVYETQQTGWTQTGNTTNQTSVLGGATACLAAACSGTSPGAFVYRITFPTDAIATVDGLNFGNVPNAGISGLKYYDTNENGQWDSGEPGLQGWPIRVDGTLTFTTAANGTFSGTLLPKTAAPFAYSIAEQQSLTGGWVQTGNTVNQSVIDPALSSTVGLTNFVYSVTPSATTPSTITGLNFGNVCRTTPGGRTIGFWSNKNGQALISTTDIAALVALNLRNADGTNFDPANKAAYRTWLLSANANNMAYMLSAQLSATVLNIRHGFTTSTTLVTVAGLSGTLTVQQVVDEANNILAAPITTSLDSAVIGLNGDLTIASGPVRTHQGSVKNTLDTINNSNAFTQPTPATCPTPTFPTT